MKEEQTGRTGAPWVKQIYQWGPILRSVVVWLGFQIALWVVFGISYMLHRDSWINVAIVASTTAAVGGWWTTLLFILVNNAFICAIIVAGNLFVRFGAVTPGLLALIIQAVSIGWVAGSNGFEVPFANVTAANLQYLRIGLWETTAYALACAVTLPKSLNIAETFPAKTWSLTRKLRDVSLSTSEITLLLLGSTALIIAATIETLAILG